jgi:pimeloyl-ACP methyl ester carboxylesterase
MVPGVGIQAADFAAEGLTAAVEQRGWPVAIATVDPGLDSYLDGSVETRLLDGIAAAQQACGARRTWLAGISLGCQAILRGVRLRPGLAEGVILLTPYLAATGLIAEVGRMGGLGRWATSNTGRPEPERTLLRWLATTPPAALPSILLGRALGDRFAATATLLADLLQPQRITSVSGAHDWASWRALWRLILDRNPFALPPATPTAPAVDLRQQAGGR